MNVWWTLLCMAFAKSRWVSNDTFRVAAREAANEAGRLYISATVQDVTKTQYEL